MKEINWREWNDAAFQEAKESNKPVLLDISAVWCHWCHVMDEITYSDQNVVDLVNERFIPIRVDSDRNPDVNTRYNMGGWPTTAFLTYTRDVLTGATYVPPNQMLAVLQRVADSYAEAGEDLVNKAQAARSSAESKFATLRKRSDSLNDVDAVLETVRSAYDHEFGGFGFEQKFPHTSALELLLFNFERTGNQEDLEIVVDTLEAMIGGEIFDNVEGGIFRYTTRRDWTVPHYEKLLDDNARIAALLLDAYRITKQSNFLETAIRVFSYIESVLMNDEIGIIHGSQDADEEYYQYDAFSRNKMEAPNVDTAAFTDSNAMFAIAYLKLYGVAKDSSAKDKALRIVDFFDSLPRSEDGSVCRYYEDEETYQYGNLADIAWLTMANLVCNEATGSEKYLNAAKELVESMMFTFRSDRGSFYDISQMRASERGLSRYGAPMSENALVALCLIKLANITGDSSFIEHATSTLDEITDFHTSYDVSASDYAITVALLSLDQLTVTVSLKPGSAETDLLIQAALGACDRNCTVKTVTATDDKAPYATVCLGDVCCVQVSEPNVLAEAVTKAIAEQGSR